MYKLMQISRIRQISLVDYKNIYTKAYSNTIENIIGKIDDIIISNAGNLDKISKVKNKVDNK